MHLACLRLGQGITGMNTETALRMQGLRFFGASNGTERLKTKHGQHRWAPNREPRIGSQVQSNHFLVTV